MKKSKVKHQAMAMMTMKKGKVCGTLTIIFSMENCPMFQIMAHLHHHTTKLAKIVERTVVDQSHLLCKANKTVLSNPMKMKLLHQVMIDSMHPWR